MSEITPAFRHIGVILKAMHLKIDFKILRAFLWEKFQSFQKNYSAFQGLTFRPKKLGLLHGGSHCHNVCKCFLLRTDGGCPPVPFRYLLFWAKTSPLLQSTQTTNKQSWESTWFECQCQVGRRITNKQSWQSIWLEQIDWVGRKQTPMFGWHHHHEVISDGATPFPNYYEWAKRTKFLLAAISGSPRQPSNSSKQTPKSRRISKKQ